MRSKDIVARQGGDEFTILLPEMYSEKCNFIAEQILTILNKPFFIQGEELSITPSIGIAMYPDYGTDVNELMKMLIWLCIVRKQMEKQICFLLKRNEYRSK